ncbi:uncharacterized protein [Panulirus ornatus]|uniref:uncharacterized protein n=1 Tax=Panulirus ornatus TaxID=150431 RepID=UPI003A894AE2
MTTERRWYEPPAPRDWNPTAAELQRLESSSSLRKALLDRTTTKAFDRSSLHSSSSRSDLYDFDKSLLESNRRGSLASRAPSSKGVPLSRSLSRGVKPEGEARGLTSMPPLPQRASSSAGNSVVDFYASASFNSKKPRDQEDVEDLLRNTPPSRARSSSMTKYDPLPAINASPQASFTAMMDSNNNKEPEFQPPPLIRSRTFDVIDTKMKNLPVVDDLVDGDDPSRQATTPHTVTVNIEGKPLTEFLSHARDGLLKSRPGTRYGRVEPAGSSTHDELRTNAIYEASSLGESSTAAVGEVEPRDESSSGGLENAGQNAEAEKDDDIIVYFKLPDDSLLLAASPKTRTLGDLLQVVANTQVGGRRLAVACDDINPTDLTRTLAELGITDNTTLYLLDQ